MYTIEQNKAVLHKIFEAINSGDVKQFQGILKAVTTPGYRLHNPTFEKSPVMLTEWWEMFEQFMKGHPDYKVTSYQIIGEGDLTATRGTAEWTDAVSKEKGQTEIFFFSRFEDGKIAEEWELFVQLPRK
jgi:predicted SnoaL-like aldol condensation-catalyzing enzyme